MERFVKGDVVVISFPFSDFLSSKRRPAFVIADGDYGDVVMCQITSKFGHNSCCISVEESDFEKGKLRMKCFIRPKKLFTADIDLILYKVGNLKKEKIKEVEDVVCNMVKD